MRALRRRHRREAFNNRALDGFVVAVVVVLVLGLFAVGYRLKDGGFSAEYVSASPLPAVVAPNGGGVTSEGTPLAEARSPLDIAVDNALSPISVVPSGGRVTASSSLLDVAPSTNGALPSSTSTSGPGSTTTTVTDPPTTTTVTDPPTTTTVTDPPTTTTVTDPPTTTTATDPPPPPDDDHHGPGRGNRNGFDSGVAPG